MSPSIESIGTISFPITDPAVWDNEFVRDWRDSEAEHGLDGLNQWSALAPTVLRLGSSPTPARIGFDGSVLTVKDYAGLVILRHILSDSSLTGENLPFTIDSLSETFGQPGVVNREASFSIVIGKRVHITRSWRPPPPDFEDRMRCAFNQLDEETERRRRVKEEQYGMGHVKDEADE